VSCSQKCCAGQRGHIEGATRARLPPKKTGNIRGHQRISLENVDGTRRGKKRRGGEKPKTTNGSARRRKTRVGTRNETNQQLELNEHQKESGVMWRTDGPGVKRTAGGAQKKPKTKSSERRDGDVLWALVQEDKERTQDSSRPYKKKPPQNESWAPPRPKQRGKGPNFNPRRVQSEILSRTGGVGGTETKTRFAGYLRNDRGTHRVELGRQKLSTNRSEQGGVGWTKRGGGGAGRAVKSKGSERRPQCRKETDGALHKGANRRNTWYGREKKEPKPTRGRKNHPGPATKQKKKMSTKD